MSIVNCVNNWYFSLCFDHNKFGWQPFINLWFIDKEVFHYESQKVKNGYRFMLHVMTRPKLWWSSNLVIIYKLQSLWAYYFKVSSSSTACTFTLFVCSTLITFGLTLCNLEQYEVDTISGDIVKTLHVIVGFLLSVILFANQNFLDDFSNWLYCLVFA